MDIQIDYQGSLYYSLGSSNKVYVKKGKDSNLVTSAYTKSNSNQHSQNLISVLGQYDKTLVLAVSKQYLYVRVQDLKISRFNLMRKTKRRDQIFTFEDGFNEISQFDVDRFGYDVVCLTEEGSFQMIKHKDKKAEVVDVLKRGKLAIQNLLLCLFLVRKESYFSYHKEEQ